MTEDTKELMIRIGRNIKYYRELSGLSMEEFAVKAGYKNRSSIAKIEAGETRIQAYKMVDFALILGVDVIDLMKETNSNPFQVLINDTPTPATVTTNDKFKDTVALLLTLDQEELERAYNVLNAMFGGGTHGKRNLER